MNFVNATHMFNPVNVATVADSDLFDPWLRGCNEPETLSDTEGARYQLLLNPRDRHKPYVGPAHRLTDRLRIVRIILVLFTNGLTNCGGINLTR